MATFTINQNNIRAQLLTSLLGDTTGLSNFEITLSGDSRAFGTFNDDPFNLTSGVVLSTGRVIDLPGINTEDGGASPSNNNLGDALSTDFGAPDSPGDSITLQIDFDADATKDKLYFQYVFGSEEFLEYAGQFNDSFSLTLNGINRAKLPSGGNVSVNTIAPTPIGPYDSSFIYNSADEGIAKDLIRLDGYTQPFIFEGNLIKNGRNRLVINIRDDRDGLLDSAVFIKGGTLGTSRPADPPGATPNVAPVALDTIVDVAPGEVVNLTTLSATDSDGNVESYTISTLPSPDQGTLFLDDPTAGGTPITLNQTLTPARSRSLFFQASSNFRDSSFTFTATDNDGATDLTPATVSLVVKRDAFGCKPGKILRGNKRANTLKGSADSDQLFGLAGNDTLWGGDCGDLLDGGRDNDKLFGGSGRDTLRGRQNDDVLYAEDGNDRLNGGLGSDRLLGGKGDDILFGRRGKDSLAGNAGNDTLSGGRGQDTLNGGANSDILHGRQNDDILISGAGDDILVGGLGKDSLLGGKGQDVFFSGRGADTLTGGAGSDQFVYYSIAGKPDRITDFNVTQDVINLSQIFRGTEYVSSAPFDDYLKLAQANSATLIRIDSNGKANGGFKLLTILEGVAVNDLNASHFVI